MKISEWLSKFGWIPAQGNAAPGRFRLSRFPHQAAMLDDPLDPRVRETFHMMASQAAGKTLCGIGRIMYAIAVRRISMLMIRATIETAREWMDDKFMPTVEATPVMDGLIAEPRKKNSKSRSLNRKFPGGALRIIGAKSRSAFRGASAGYIEQDEIDAYEATKEGDPCALGDRAAITFSNAWKIKYSTPTLEGFSRIEEGYKRGDQQKYFLPCPICGGFQDLKFSQLKFSFTPQEYERFKEAQDSTGLPEPIPHRYTWTIGDNLPNRDLSKTMYVCEHCSRGWRDVDRIRAYLSGHTENKAVAVNGKELRAEWRATAEFNGIRSRYLNGMYLTIGLEKGYDNFLQQFAEKFLEAKRGGRETLMAWTNMFDAKAFADAAEKLDWQVIAERAKKEDADCSKEVPVQAVWINWSMDIQQDRVEIAFYGWGDAQECWCLDYHVIYGDFDMPEMQDRVWDYLDNKRFTHPYLGELKWDAGVIDSGKQTKVKAVYKFAAKHRLSNVFSCKGFDQALGALYQRQTERTYGGIRFNFNVDTLKATVFYKLKNTDHGPNRIHFAKHLDANFFQGLCSERRLPQRQPKGGIVYHWVKHSSSTRNEPLDLTVYAHGLFEVCRKQEWIARKWKEVQEKLKEENKPDPSENGREEIKTEEEAKVPETPRPNLPRTYRLKRRVRIASPFGGRF